MINLTHTRQLIHGNMMSVIQKKYPGWPHDQHNKSQETNQFTKSIRSHSFAGTTSAAASSRAATPGAAEFQHATLRAHRDGIERWYLWCKRLRRIQKCNGKALSFYLKINNLAGTCMDASYCRSSV